MPYTITTKRTWSQTMDELGETFERWNVRAVDWSVSGDSRAWNRRFESLEARRVKLTFRHPTGKTVTVSMDKQYRPVDNLRAIYLAIEDLRMIERRGLSDLVGMVYLQLSAAKSLITGEMADDEAYRILELQPGTSPDIVAAVYRTLAKRYHPDTPGGDAVRFRLITAAYEALTRQAVPA